MSLATDLLLEESNRNRKLRRADSGGGSRADLVRASRNPPEEEGGPPGLLRQGAAATVGIAAPMLGSIGGFALGGPPGALAGGATGAAIGSLGRQAIMGQGFSPAATAIDTIGGAIPALGAARKLSTLGRIGLGAAQGAAENVVGGAAYRQFVTQEDPFSGQDILVDAGIGAGLGGGIRGLFGGPKAGRAAGTDIQQAEALVRAEVAAGRMPQEQGEAMIARIRAGDFKPGGPQEAPHDPN